MVTCFSFLIEKSKSSCRKAVAITISSLFYIQKAEANYRVGTFNQRALCMNYKNAWYHENKSDNIFSVGGVKGLFCTYCEVSILSGVVVIRVIQPLKRTSKNQSVWTPFPWQLAWKQTNILHWLIILTRPFVILNDKTRRLHSWNVVKNPKPCF